MANLSPTDLAKRARISVPYASQLLKGRRMPSLELALRIYGETGVQLGLLEGLTPDEIDVMRKAAA